jgi:magnesium-transporting ATPase (P-type)
VGARREATRFTDLPKSVCSSLVLLLIIAAAISRVLGERTEAVVILAIVCLNACLGFCPGGPSRVAFLPAFRDLISRP